MTIAVCVKCGALKHGAFGRCGSCGQAPETDSELAYSLALTDHYLSPSELEAYSASMRAGTPPPSMSPEQEEEFKQMIRPSDTLLRKLLSVQKES